MPSFAALVRELRTRALLSQEELARRSGLSVGTIRGLEAGRIRRPRGGSLRLLADALNLSDQDRELLSATAFGDPVDTHADRSVAHADSSVAHADSSVAAVPAQLPRAIAGFAGRHDQLKILDGLFSSTEQGPPVPVVISAIAGTAGVGKTALAVHWAHRAAHLFPDGQLHLDLLGYGPGRSPVEPADAVRRLLDSLGVQPHQLPSDMDGQIGLYRSLIANRRMLILFDNARDADQVRPLLPGSPGSMVLVTSRNQLSGLVATDGAHLLILDLLPDAEARDLLAARIGIDRVGVEPDAAQEIVAHCAGLPLALAVVAGRAAAQPGFSLADLAGQLREARGGLDAFQGGDLATDVRTVFSWSVKALSPAAARLFRLLSLHPGAGMTVAAASSLADLTGGEVRPLLAELSRAHLIAESTPGRYTFHDLLRAYAGELAGSVDTDEQRQAARRRMLDHFLHTAYEAARLLSPNRIAITLAPAGPGAVVEHLTDREQAGAWFANEHPAVLAAVEQAWENGFDSHTWQLTWTLRAYFDRMGRWHDLLAASSLALNAAERSGDLVGQASTQHFLAYVYSRVERFEEAAECSDHALELYRELGDSLGLAHSIVNRAMVVWSLGRREEAIANAEKAVELLRESGPATEEASALNNLGWFHALNGDYQQTIAYCERALALQRQLGDDSPALTWDTLGYAHHHLGNYAQAIESYQNSVAILRHSGERYLLAITLSRLGDSLTACGSVDSARRAWQEAIGILDEMEHPEADQVRAKLA